MKRPNPELKMVCSECLFCANNPPVCIAFGLNQSIGQREYFNRPHWCPFLPYPKLF